MKRVLAGLGWIGLLIDLSGTRPAGAYETIHRDLLFDSGKLLATGGVSQVEGAGGGGLTPWALITSYGTEDGIGANAHATYIHLPDFTLRSAGVAVGLFDRFELSYARQAFDTGAAGARLGLGRGFTFHTNIYGAKIKLIGSGVYDQDLWLPQIAAGIQYKTVDRGAIVTALGGRDDDGVDYYVSATKILLERNLLLNATLRATKANQFGILGFGGDKHDNYRLAIEGSAAYLFSRRLAAGVEYRSKPDNLSFAREGDAYDVFVAYFVNKHLSATLAYVNLGPIALQGRQDGAYFSLQAGF